MKQRNALCPPPPKPLSKMFFSVKKELYNNCKSFALKTLYFNKKTTLTPTSYVNIKWLDFGCVLSVAGEQTGAKLLFLKAVLWV